jgi:hypothetical protein
MTQRMDCGCEVSYCPLHEAAPDLLEAARAAVLHLYRFQGESAKATVQKLEDAIAKAEGRS